MREGVEGGLGMVAPHLFLIDLSIQNNPELKKVWICFCNFQNYQNLDPGEGGSPIQLQTKTNKQKKEK